ncbi:actin [Diplonema papillatum]|nr:actin [Diplonema papillatum]
MAFSDKPLVLDLGSQKTRVGVAGHAQVRLEADTEETLRRQMTDEGGIVHTGQLSSFARHLVTTGMMTPFTQASFVATANTACRDSLTDALRTVLGPKSTILNAQACALASASSHSGLVIDIGEAETRVVPIVQGVVLEWHAKFSKQLHARLVKDRFSEAFRRLNSAAAAPTHEQVERYLLKHGCVSARGAEAVTLELPNAAPPVTLPVSQGYEAFFDGSEPSPDGVTLQRLAVDVLRSVEIVQRRHVASCVLVCGAVADAEGFTIRLAQEVVALLETAFPALAPAVRFSQPLFPRSRCAFVGASLLRSTPALLP